MSRALLILLAGIAMAPLAMFAITLQRPDLASRATWKERHRA